MKVGQRFLKKTPNRMTITSSDATGEELWEVVEIVSSDTVKCELKNTNISMYSGSGRFKLFNIEQVNDCLL